MIQVRAGVIGTLIAASLAGASAPARAEDAPAPRSSEQLAVLSGMVDASPSEVQGRLDSDPQFASSSTAAMEARASRRRTGTAMAILGFSIAGVGDIAGALLIVTARSYPNIQNEDWGRVGTGLVVGVVSLGVGLGIAIPGVVKIGRPGDEENRLYEYYRQGGPPPQSAPPTPVSLAAPVPSSGPSMMVPVFSYRF